MAKALINQGASDVNHIILENSPDEADNNAQLFSIYLPEEIAPVRDETIVVQAQMTLQEIVQLAVAEALRTTGEPLNSIQDKESAEIKRV